MNYSLLGPPTRIIGERHVVLLRTGDITLTYCGRHGLTEHRFEYDGKKKLVCLECEKAEKE